MTALLPALVAALTSRAMIAHPIELDVIRPADAVPLNGRFVRSTFTVACPPGHAEHTTVLGCGHDAVERSAYIPKDLSIDRGDTVAVAGILEVVPHPPLVINGQRVPAWTEIRISDVRRVKR